MMDRFLGYFGLSLVVVPIMSTSHFPVNFHQLLKRQTRKSLNEFCGKSSRFTPEIARMEKSPISKLTVENVTDVWPNLLAE